MGFAPSHRTGYDTFHPNAGEHLYPVATGDKMGFIGVSHAERITRNSKKKPWGYGNTALVLAAPEQMRTWEWLQ